MVRRSISERLTRRFCGTSLGCVVALIVTAPLSMGYAGDRTIGLVLTRMNYAMHETDGAKDECPDGLAFDSYDNWKASLPAALIKALPPDAPELQFVKTLSSYYQNTGPQGENVCTNPTVVRDPLPLRTVQSKVAFGLNLDGTQDGKETPGTCAHKKFMDPDNPNLAVDNQLYRAIGCIKGWRKSGFLESFYNNEIPRNPTNRILVEVRDVDDELNDSDVEVTFYKGRDKVVQDGAGKVIPWQSIRVDVDAQDYITRTRGKIVDGVLTTDPATTRFAKMTNAIPSQYLLHDMQARLVLGKEGAKGLFAGYMDLPLWWLEVQRFAKATSISGFSCPSLYAGVHELADGSRDPRTGNCSSISAAMDVDLVRAYVIDAPREKGEKKTVENIKKNNTASARHPVNTAYAEGATQRR